MDPTSVCTSSAQYKYRFGDKVAEPCRRQIKCEVKEIGGKTGAVGVLLVDFTSFTQFSHGEGGPG
jgi:hypothetical protein